jgi:peptidoglycan/xylan/chitin deacetylase (PgdA/CDA1 family)
MPQASQSVENRLTQCDTTGDSTTIRTRGSGLRRRTQVLSLLLALVAIAGVVLPEWLSSRKADEPKALLGGNSKREPLGIGSRSRPVRSQSERTGNSDRLRVVVRTAPNLPDAASVESVVDRLVAAGVTEVWVQFKQDDTDEVLGGMAFYPSSIAPVAPGFEDGRLDRFVKALDAKGLRVCGWVPCLNDASAAEAHPEWRAAIADASTGESVTQANWLCPRNEEVIEYEGSILAEVAERFPRLSAIYTDFIRFDSDFSCACDLCLSAVARRHGSGQISELTPKDLIQAASERTPLWRTWTELRARAICDAVDTFRDKLDEVREGMWFGACVLPFSAEDYAFNTQSGQDYYEMARVGLDEIVVMGYWDDWGKDVRWLSRCIDSARKLVGDECELSCLIDGDMSIRRTWLTLDVLRNRAEAQPGFSSHGFFHYGRWSDREFDTVLSARAASAAGLPVPPKQVSVSIRIDTEPDYQGSYDAVSPEMIDRLVDMFDSLGVKATFVTCGRLAELQPAPLQRAVEHGHEIACHAYDHEQLDSLSLEEQISLTDRGFAALAAAGLPVIGFGAPRNSITPRLRDHLLERGVAWDGSAAYDPLRTAMDAEILGDASDPARSMVVIPFIIPNDWDALYVARDSPDQMLEQWKERLDIVARSGEPVFVIDVHQWIASGTEEIRVLKAFIEHAMARSDCSVVPMRDAAMAVRRYVASVEESARAALNQAIAPLPSESLR